MNYYTNYDSPLGNIIIGSNEDNILGVWFETQDPFSDAGDEEFILNDNLPVLQNAVNWLDAYFAGSKPDISQLPLTPVGNDFKQCVWKILTEIPYGATMTYGQVAKEVASRMGKERMSAQAVGGAVGRNPISIIIPCHRVMGAGGNITGYTGGVDIKLWLLKHENVDMTGFYIPNK